MKTIKTDFVLVDHSGKPLKFNGGDLTIGYALSTVLAGKSSNPTLAWVFGKKFATEPKVDLKAEDIVFLKQELNASEAWHAVVTGQIVEILDSADKEEKPEK